MSWQDRVARTLTRAELFGRDHPYIVSAIALVLVVAVAGLAR